MQKYSPTRIINMAKISIATNFLLALAKIALSIYFSTFYYFMYAIYNIGIIVSKVIAIKQYSKDEVKEQEKEDLSKFHIIGIVVLLASFAFLGYGVFRYLQPEPTNYGTIAGVTIATITVVELYFAIRGLIITRRNKEPMLIAIKLVNLVSAITSVALTQTALLSFTAAEFTTAAGIGAMVFGALTSVIGFHMLFTNKIYKM